MRLHFAVRAIVALLGAAAAAGLSGILSASTASPKLVQARTTTVDVQLVLAVDISYSMDPDELALQREGYIAALTSPEFLQAIRQGINGRVAVLYFEWAGVEIQHIVVPWRMIDGPESADAFASEIARAPQRRGSRTSISGALAFAMPLFEGGGYRGLRRVIDVSGDGVNNNGPPVTLVRDEVVAKGITINGLPIMLKRPYPGAMDIENLDVYYEDCVIGGPGAFVVPIRAREEFKSAIRTKLVLEIAGRTPMPRLLRASESRPRISCTIGERMWQQRWGN
ncbi:MAG TPA: DUF1194 domain-containing protein [Xanthobacteraceae bacterium]|nr:DUF1194 domain-containing protein [Xanthobacteraceae bacterium]